MNRTKGTPEYLYVVTALALERSMANGVSTSMRVYIRYTLYHKYAELMISDLPASAGEAREAAFGRLINKRVGQTSSGVIREQRWSRESELRDRSSQFKMQCSSTYHPAAYNIMNPVPTPICVRTTSSLTLT